MRRPTFVTGLAAGLLAAGGCAAESEPELPSDPIAQMEIAFDGSPPQDEIRDALDRALRSVDLPSTADNYSRAGSVLVTMRQEYGISEMDLLGCIPTAATDGDTFPEVTSKCVARLG